MKQSAVRLIPKAERAPAVETPPSTERAQFTSHMVMVRHFADIADAAEGEYIYRNLLQTCRFLERRHGFKRQEDI